MFILYAVLVGLLVGVLAGGRASGLGRVRFRWAPLVFAGFLTQVVLFSAPVAERVGWLGAPIYVASTALVLVVLLRNMAVPGLPIVALGALSNFLAIVANGGYMPASAGALAALGKSPAAGYSNSAVVADPALAPLTDVFALPARLPFANVFSIGDVLIGVGVAAAIVVAMRAWRDDAQVEESEAASVLHATPGPEAR
ncbi:MAG: hypothetical protein E6I94_06620 [Chloroflexi bacterium]|nr:MAG: hypothetical protein E6I94_06620 [Chloroflexota bacterium]